jgi:hypothetical protein
MLKHRSSLSMMAALALSLAASAPATAQQAAPKRRLSVAPDFPGETFKGKRIAQWKRERSA